jgi:cellulose synthase/poly-beta-1,6-N-acetylglucosamine synthase-like glycosyltransferase
MSLLNQSYPNFELIAIDDSSTDNTLQIMNKVKDGLDTDLSIILAGKMKIISLTDKPDEWTGKTWDLVGYLHAKGEIILFADADTCFFDKDALFHAVSYFQNENLDVLTGHAKIELPNFWSKITMPLWDFFSVILDQNPSAVNNTSSSAAYLVGSFHIIRRKVLEFLGDFNCVRNEIKEDVQLGRRIKKAGFKLRIVKMDKFYSALWSRDLLSLWHGIRRTFFGMNKFRVFANVISFFLLTIFLFLILPHTISSFHIAAGTIAQSVSALGENSVTNTDHLCLACSQLTILDISSCIMITIGTAIKDMRKNNISPFYSLLALPGAVVLIFAYVTSIFPLFTWSKKLQWRSRSYEYQIGN